MKPSAARSFLLRLSIIALGGASVAALSGCHAEDCAEAQQCGSEPVPREAPRRECVADPSAGRAEDPCGVFVSASMGSDDNPGTRAQPVRSMARAITLAQSGPSRVYACAETFAEPVVLPSGVELRGGLDCADDWAYAGGDRRTILAPGADAIPLRVTAGDGLSIVADIRAEAADAVQAGGSSIAAIVLPDAAVEILRSELSAGNGAQGARGEDGGAEPAPVGMPGEAGANACIATTVQGGPAVEMTCGDMATFGGQGGQGGITAGTEGSDGQPEPVPNPQGWGLGGAGETSSAQCSPGEMGRDGLSADHGLGGSGLGRISAEGWQGANGQDGGHGLPGQGGGGGGGRRGGALLCGANLGNRGGAGGGSGGAGGCGGRGGTGGGFGGASIGLIALSADVVLRETSITAGNGGDGGTGGLLQPGGAGGPGGPGGSGFAAAPVGCPGGWGGSGGNGGNGGGGLGGASIGIAHLSSAPVTQEGVTLRMGQPGRGGPGGNPAVPGSSGADGPAAVLLPFEQ